MIKTTVIIVLANSSYRPTLVSGKKKVNQLRSVISNRDIK